MILSVVGKSANASQGVLMSHCGDRGFLTTALGKMECYCAGRPKHPGQEHAAPITGSNCRSGWMRWGKGITGYVKVGTELPDLDRRCSSWLNVIAPTWVTLVSTDGGLPALKCELGSGHKGQCQRSSLPAPDGSVTVAQWN